MPRGLPARWGYCREPARLGLVVCCPLRERRRWAAQRVLAFPSALGATTRAHRSRYERSERQFLITPSVCRAPPASIPALVVVIRVPIRAFTRGTAWRHPQQIGPAGRPAYRGVPARRCRPERLTAALEFGNRTDEAVAATACGSRCERKYARSTRALCRRYEGLLAASPTPVPSSREAIGALAHGGGVVAKVAWRGSPTPALRETPRRSGPRPRYPLRGWLARFSQDPSYRHCSCFSRPARPLSSPTHGGPGVVPPPPAAVSSLREAIGTFAHGGVAIPRVPSRTSPTLPKREGLHALWLRPTVSATRVVGPFLPKPIFPELLVFPSFQPAVPARGLALFEWV
jgi:hypothetical protein